MLCSRGTKGKDWWWGEGGVGGGLRSVPRLLGEQTPGMDEDCEPLLPPHRSAGLSGEARNRFRGSLMLDIFPEATFKQFFS